MKNLFLGLIFICFTIHSNAQCTLDKSGWKIIFQEEFNGTKTDLDANWYYSEYFGTSPYPLHRAWTVCGDGSPYTCNTEDKVDVHNGLGFFSVEKMPAPFPCDDKIATHKSSQICAKFDEFPSENPPNFTDRNGFVFGMFEIRCRLTKKGFTYPNFWLSGNSWPPEIDIFEYHGGSNNFFSSFHWDFIPGVGTQKCTDYFNNTSININDGFHVWTMVWTPTAITMFLDNREYYTFNDVSRIPASSGYGDMWTKMHLILGNSYFCGDPGTDEGVYDDFVVDYVKVYKPSGYREFNPFIDTRSSFFAEQAHLYSTTNYKSTADWVSNIVKPDLFYPSDNVVSDLVGLQGGGKFKYKGSYGLLWSTYWSGGNFYNYPVDWTHTVDDNIVLAESPSGGEITFFRSGTNIYYEDGSFHLIPTVFDAASDIVTNKSGNIVFYRTSAGRVKSVTYSGGTWSSPVTVPAAGLGTCLPNTLMYNDLDNSLYYISDIYKIVEYNSSGITSSLGGVSDAFTNLIISPDGNQLFYVNISGVLKTLSKSLIGPWSSSSDFFVYNGFGLVPVTDIKNRTLLISPGSSAIVQLYYVGYDDKPHCIYRDGPYYRVGNISDNVLVASDFKLIKFGVTPVTKPHISFKGVDNFIHTLSWEDACGKNPLCFTDPNKKVLLKSTQNTEISTEQSFNSLNIYPNPTTDYIKVVNFKNVGLNKIIIRSIEGKVVFEDKVDPLMSECSINIAFLPNALYYCELHSASGTKILKLVKNE